jgi:hypothetical protein
MAMGKMQLQINASIEMRVRVTAYNAMFDFEEEAIRTAKAFVASTYPDEPWAYVGAALENYDRYAVYFVRSREAHDGRCV